MSHSECSKFMGKGSRAQAPLRITPKLIDAATYMLEQVGRNSGYQAERRYSAAKRWAEGVEMGETIWLGISGAATPVGLGGLVADLIKIGAVHAIVSTGANVYHDLHFACGLPVRHGSAHVDDGALRKEGVTRIYDRFIHNTTTLQGQDMINQTVFRRACEKGSLKQPFSTAEMIHAFGLELADSKFVADREGSFVLAASKYGVPVFLDSAANHSLGMDFSLLDLEGRAVNSSPSRDIRQAAALSIYGQPQFNVFLGEGGPRNFAQTTGPTASEIFKIPFDGSEGCIRLTTADERTGGLSGSTESEAVTWWKYPDAKSTREVVVWGEYTLTFPEIAGYVAGKVGQRPHARLIDRFPEFEARFLGDIGLHRTDLETSQADILAALPRIRAHEMKLRREATNL